MMTTPSPPSRLASQLLRHPLRRAWWVGVVWVLAGCVLPQEENLLTELPVPANNPPRILENQVLPPYRIIRGYGLFPTCSLEFSAIVEDLDVADRLRAYWYVDYDPNVPRGADRQYTVYPAKEAKAVREERATLRAIYNSADLYRLNVPGDHVVELIIADRPLSDGVPEPDQIPLADGTIFSRPGYTTSYVWFVHTEAGATCP